MIISPGAIDRLYRLAGGLAAISLVVTVIGTLLPGQDLPPDLPPDTFLHAMGFGIPTLLTAFAVSTRRRMLALVLAIAVVAVSTELLQNFVPDRDASLHDVAANAFGIVVGCVLGPDQVGDHGVVDERLEPVRTPGRHVQGAGLGGRQRERDRLPVDRGTDA